MSTVRYRHPEAYRAGLEAATNHYGRVDAGEVEEHEDRPPNPYPSCAGYLCDGCEREAWNWGWFHGIPDIDPRGAA